MSKINTENEKISSKHKFNNDILNYIPQEDLSDYIDEKLIHSLARHLVNEKVIEIKKDKCDIIPDTTVYSSEFYIMSTNEFNDLCKCLSYIHINTINPIIDRHIDRIAEILNINKFKFS